MQKKLYWIKLYIEVLDDHRLGMLDGYTWRHAMEFFLLAGYINRGGLLPAIDIMSWRLKAPQEELFAALCKFEQLGITSRDENGNWFVTNFARRQAAFSGADRSRLYRQRYANRDEEDEIQRETPVAQSPEDPVPQERDDLVVEQRDENVAYTESDTESDTDSDTDQVCDSHTSGQAYFARAFKTQPTPTQLLNLAQLEKTHGYTRLSQVIDWAVSSGIPPGRALRAIHTAIQTWSEAPPPNGRAGDPHHSDKIEKLRRKYSDDLDS